MHRAHEAGDPLPSKLLSLVLDYGDKQALA